MPDRALTYARVSTGAQEDDGSSLETQRDRCIAYVTQQDYQHVEHIADTFSGALYRERPGLSRLREMVRAGVADVVIAYAIDRLSRNQAHLAIIAEEASDHGARLEFVTESFEDSAVGRFLRSAKAFAAEVEREKIAERSIRGKLARLQSGRLIIPHNHLYGYQPNETRDRYLIDPITSPIVQRIYRSVMDGMTLRQISRSLTSDNILSPSGQLAWSISQLSNILRHPAYTGRAVAGHRAHNGRQWSLDDAITLPDGVIPPLVDTSLWEAAQARLTRNKQLARRNTREPFAALLRGGVARCGSCGRALSVQRHTSGNLTYACRQYNNYTLPAPAPVPCG